MFILSVCVLVNKFTFDFNHFNSSLSGLSNYIDTSIELDSKYHMILLSSDCEVIYGSHNSSLGVCMEFVFLDFDSVKTFISLVNIMRNDWFKRYNTYCSCTIFNCFNNVDIYFIKHEGDISLQDLICKVMDYEGIDHVESDYLEGFVYKYKKYLFSFYMSIRRWCIKYLNLIKNLFKFK